MGQSFLDVNKEAMDVLGFWTEDYRSSLIKQMELRYKTEAIKVWHITDLVINGDKVLINWKKRFRPLSKQELKDEYGR